METWVIFFSAALALAFAPGPGMLYVLARTLEGGKKAGLLSTLGTACGGIVHVIAAAIGVSALIAASQTTFLLLKFFGGIFLIYLGIKTLLANRFKPGPVGKLDLNKCNTRNLMIQGLLTETFNPKTGLFFLAFIPQFVNPASGPVLWQFIGLGLLVVLLNCIPDILIAYSSKPATVLLAHPLAMKVKRLVSGIFLIALGIYTLFSGPSKIKQPGEV